MPYKTQSIATLREQKPASAASGREKREREYARRFEQFRDLVQWMQEFWDGQTLTLPLPPIMGNNELAYAHRMVKVSRKNEYKGQITTLASLGLLPPPPREPPAKVLLKATFYVRHVNDPTGRAERCKWPVDWMVKAGYMTDDNDKHLQWEGMPEQVIVRHEPPRIEFKLKEI